VRAEALDCVAHSVELMADPQAALLFRNMLKAGKILLIYWWCAIGELQNLLKLP
jgi:hypothetical protein